MPLPAPALQVAPVCSLDLCPPTYLPPTWDMGERPGYPLGMGCLRVPDVMPTWRPKRLPLQAGLREGVWVFGKPVMALVMTLVGEAGGSVFPLVPSRQKGKGLELLGQTVCVDLPV